MHDIKFIREHPEQFDQGMQRRGLKPCAQELLYMDKMVREHQTELQALQAKRNELAKAIAQAKKNGGDAEALMEESREVGAALKDMEHREDVALTTVIEGLPNLLAEDVPDGKDESDNRVERTEGTKPEFSFKPKDHVELGEALGILDFESAAKVSGARFVFMRGALARMERALAQFMLDTHTQEFGYEEVVPPFLVRDTALYGTGQLPKFAEDNFKTTTGHWLIPTSEVPLTNIVADQILQEEDLPIRFTAYTPCFRSEAGSAGKDTRGMIRLHQFTKVELVSITTPEKSEEEHQRKLSAAENILKKLGLHYQVVTLCAGDTGFSAQKTYDLEVWMPGQDKFREISSISNFGPFQGRRMKARFRKEGEKQTEPVHTLNGSGLAIGRTMVAILENYQQEDGSIVIPEALQPYMGGIRIEPVKSS